MSLVQETSDGQYQIKSFEGGKLTINDVVYTRSVIVGPQCLITDWQPQTFSDVSIEHLSIMEQMNPQCVIIGSGETCQLLAPHLSVALMEKGIGVESMDTYAASRTFMALVSEGRHVVAALLLR